MEYFFCDYNWIERSIDSNASQLKALGVTDIVGISRGGIIPAFMAAQILDKPNIHLLNYNRKTREVQPQFSGQISAESTALLCEDVVGQGNTMLDCLAYLKGKVKKVITLSVVYFKASAMRPDFGYYNDSSKYYVLPWERHVFNPAFRENHRINGYHEKSDSGYFVYGADLDGIFLPDIEEQLYQTDLQEALRQRAKLEAYESTLFPTDFNQNWIIVTGRPSDGQSHAEEWLKRHGIACAKLLMRDNASIGFTPHDNSHLKAERTAKAKAEHIQREGITHFYESDLLQATLIASLLPMIRVCWWNNALNVRKWITAEDIVHIPHVQPTCASANFRVDSQP